MRKEAVKKVIASMTVGKDVSTLFPDVLKNIQTDDIELKKLVYLYLMNYAKCQPELVILAINTFCKVCSPAYSSSFHPTGRRGSKSTRAGARHTDDGLPAGRQGFGLPV